MPTFILSLLFITIALSVVMLLILFRRHMVVEGNAKDEKKLKKCEEAINTVSDEDLEYLKRLSRDLGPVNGVKFLMDKYDMDIRCAKTIMDGILVHNLSDEDIEYLKKVKKDFGDDAAYDVAVTKLKIDKKDVKELINNL